MKKHATQLSGVFLLEPQVFGDSRGWFYESFNEKTFRDLGLNTTFVQDNESFSSYGVVRGLHFQKGDFAQAKLVRVLYGHVLDVAVDIRTGSPTFGKHVAVELSGENKLQLFIPRGFAHGFAVLSKTAHFAYKCDNFYAPSSEGSINALDPTLAIDWLIPKDLCKFSQKDLMAPSWDKYCEAPYFIF